MNRNKTPMPRRGYQWEWREGCDCKFCFWKGHCLGETRQHWIEVKVDDAARLACEIQQRIEQNHDVTVRGRVVTSEPSTFNH
jgi:hypothetical protein